MKPGNIYRADSGTTYRVCGRVFDCSHSEWELLPVELSGQTIESIHGAWSIDVSTRQTALTIDEYTARHMATPMRVDTEWFEYGAKLVKEAQP